VTLTIGFANSLSIHSEFNAAAGEGYHQLAY
jgi:hypothetical protein